MSSGSFRGAVEVKFYAAAAVAVFHLVDQRLLGLALGAHPERERERTIAERTLIGELRVSRSAESHCAVDLAVVVGHRTLGDLRVAAGVGGVLEVVFERVVGEQTHPGGSRDEVKSPRLPLRQQFGDLIVGQLSFGGFDLALDLAQPAFLRRRRQLQQRLRIAPLPVESLLGDVVKEGEEAVEVLLRDGVVLVIVAAPATHRHAQPDGGGGVEAVDDVLGLVLLGDRAALVVDHVVAVEAGGNQLLAGRVRQQVAGQLLDRETVEGHVAVERVDDPVAPMPHVAV